MRLLTYGLVMFLCVACRPDTQGTHSVAVGSGGVPPDPHAGDEVDETADFDPPASDAGIDDAADAADAGVDDTVDAGVVPTFAAASNYGFCDPFCGGIAGPAESRDWARCYSCLCKLALGDLPRPKDYASTASASRPITIYKFDPLKAPDDVQPATDDASPCLNPARLVDVAEDAKCYRGSVLGVLRLTGGEGATRYNSYFFYIYRKKEAASLTVENRNKYDDFGMIGYNTLNGATCWWDDKDGETVNGTAMPAIDLWSKPDKEVDDFLGQFKAQEGAGCIACHDNDPFLYTPFLRSRWPIHSPWRNVPYKRVYTEFRGPQEILTRYVTSYRNEGVFGRSCRGCHRIAEFETRASWIHDSLGASPLGQQALPRNASDEAKSFLRWMPPDDPSVDTPILGCVAGGDLPGGSPVTVNNCVWQRP